ncbi:MAG: VWA domain-containing protein [Crocinitomicaceae bacterium]|nr:VWA domain-containing protein [Crocinitomicaceae bacterium]
MYYEEPETLETVYEDEVDTVSIPDPVVINEVPEDTITEPEIVTIIPPLNDIPDTILDPGYFKFSNITFILDASSSMNSYGKLDLMKMSMIELVKILRPDDNVTVLKYAAEAQVLLEHVSGDKKEEIISVIKGIKTSGSTAGGDAIKVAYALNKQRHLHDGNNLIIMITDGLFNKGSTDYDATIENYFKSDGTRFSVVGIKTTDFVAEHMETIVTKGGGDFIEIHTIHDAQTKLIAEIRRTAYKG